MNEVQKYYCVYVCIDKRYVSLCQFTSRQEAEMMRQKAISRQRQYNEKNLLVMTPAEVGKEFGTGWVRIHTAYS